MDNRKRARMEAVECDAVNDAAVTNIGGQSIFLSNSGDAVSMLPANVFLTICDENSDESQEFLAIDSSTLAAHIKQEQDVGTQTSTTLPLQYRIVNQLQRQLASADTTTASTPALATTPSSSAINANTAAVLPAAMQLPSGCEIYLVKEYVENANAAPLVGGELLNNAPSPTSTSNAATTKTTTTTIKIEPDSRVHAATGGGVQLMRSNVPCVLSPKLPASANLPAAGAETNGKRSYILEAYKKRDDKRRATHNEVERRRRDKINSWIFKLKEMLPTDLPNHNTVTTTVISNNNTNSTNVSALCNEQQRNVGNSSNNNNSNNGNNYNNNSRTPPSDSKSQILIKACEYIKAMQDEIKSLRECLTENENLRLCNQRLQSELNKFKSERSVSNSNNFIINNNNSSSNSNSPNSNNFNITLNSLNSSNLFGGTDGSVVGATTGLASNGPNSASNTYAKRELIIRDYVD